MICKKEKDAKEQTAESRYQTAACVDIPQFPDRTIVDSVSQFRSPRCKDILETEKYEWLLLFYSRSQRSHAGYPSDDGIQIFLYLPADDQDYPDPGKRGYGLQQGIDIHG